MKPARLTLALVALAVSLLAVPAFAERNMVPTLDRSFDVCPDRPAEPNWMQEIPLRQASQRVLVQDIYHALNLERIVEIVPAHLIHSDREERFQLRIDPVPELPGQDQLVHVEHRRMTEIKEERMPQRLRAFIEHLIGNETIEQPIVQLPRRIQILLYFRTLFVRIA